MVSLVKRSWLKSCVISKNIINREAIKAASWGMGPGFNLASLAQQATMISTHGANPHIPYLTQFHMAHIPSLERRKPNLRQYLVTASLTTVKFLI